MSAIVLGVDLGTTTITSLAVEPEADAVVAVETVANDAEVTSASDRALGRSEWSPQHIAQRACQCIRAVVERLGSRSKDVAGIGITGQQHGVILVDGEGRPRTPLVNWQDRRGDQPMPGTSRTYVQQAAFLAGADVAERTGCHLATGFMGVTMFWWKAEGLLPPDATACFLGDYLGSVLTGRQPVSDPTNAASSGLLDVRQRRWDESILDALGLPRSMFPEIREADEPLGPLGNDAAIGLAAGTPVFVAMGDSQAAFLGSIRDCQGNVLVNVGTGAQVVAAIGDFQYAMRLETRPLPRRGNLLVSAQPCGGRAYAILEAFFAKTLDDLGGLVTSEKVYDTMTRLAESVPPGAAGLRCMPLFTGTRAAPELRASWTGVSPENFTPAHMTRALLEGMADVLHDDYVAICRAAGRSYRRVVGSGNGVRRNGVLRRAIAEKFAMPLETATHEEEAAVGAARTAAAGLGLL